MLNHNVQTSTLAPGADGHPHGTFIVAELSANHQHDLERTLETIDAIAATGADAVKLQTYAPESLTLDLHDGHFGPRTDGPWKGWRPYDLYQVGALPYDWHEPVFARVHKAGMVVFSTPFDAEGVSFLETLNCPIYKVASLEINHVPLLEAIAATGKPIILSTGAATLGDVEEALQVIGPDRTDVTILKCTTAYPTPYAEVHLRGMKALAEAFGMPVGLSDHTPGHTVAVAGAALGASVIEKHVTLDRAAGGIDAPFSMEPSEFRELVEAVRVVEVALGEAGYALAPSVASARTRARSIFVARPVRAGEAFDDSNIRVVRPAAGLHPRHLSTIIGRRAVSDLEPGTPLAWQHVR